MNNDPKDDSWTESGQNNGTYSHPDRQNRASFETGSNGTIYIREQGAYNGLQVYDSKTHGTPDK